MGLVLVENLQRLQHGRVVGVGLVLVDNLQRRQHGRVVDDPSQTLPSKNFTGKLFVPGSVGVVDLHRLKHPGREVNVGLLAAGP